MVLSNIYYYYYYYSFILLFSKTHLSSRLLYKNLKIKIYKTITVVLYGCETWFLALKEESRLRVFENTILRRIFGPKRDEIGEWRRLHNGEIHSLYLSLNIKRGRKDNVRMDLKEISTNTRNWVYSAQDMDIGEPLWMRHWTSSFHKPWS